MAWQDSPPNPPYQIVETDEFLEQAKDLCDSMQNWDEIKSAFDLDLAKDPLFTKDPSVLNRIPGTDLYGITIRCFPPLTLFYTVNVTLRKLTLVEIHPL